VRGLPGRVGYEEDDALRRVSRYVTDVEPNVSQLDHVSMVHHARSVGLGEALRLFRPAVAGPAELRSGLAGQVSRAGHEVRVDVRLRDGYDAQVFAACYASLSGPSPALAGVVPPCTTATRPTDAYVQ
jgi:hypothetical protein